MTGARVNSRTLRDDTTKATGRDATDGTAASDVTAQRVVLANGRRATRLLCQLVVTSSFGLVPSLWRTAIVFHIFQWCRAQFNYRWYYGCSEMGVGGRGKRGRKGTAEGGGGEQEAWMTVSTVL